jgi:tripartite-type tricarboxylate transporter receptor subunit TctC
MLSIGRYFRLACSIALSVLACAANAQPYPSKPVRIIVPFAQGGAADLLSRMVGQRLQEAWGQPVLVENRTGANGNIGMEAAAKSTPDGYTLVQAPNGNIVVNPNLFAKLPYAQSDFAPVAQLARVENVLVVHPSVAANAVAELLALARAQPGKLSFASPGVGSQAHLAGEFLRLRGSVELLHVAYKGVGPALNDLLGGQVSMMFAAVPSALPHIKSGKLRALGLASLQRSPVIPDVPTVAEQNLAGFEAVSWYSILAPAGTPKDIITRINGEISRMLEQPETREKLAGIGATAIGGTPEQLAAVIHQESAMYADLVKRAGIRAE